MRLLHGFGTLASKVAAWMYDFGLLGDYIVGASVKRLSGVECDPERSHQHELHGTRQMCSYLGDGGEYRATFLRLEDDEQTTETCTGKVTWYDARKNHPTRSEYRFYYQRNPALGKAVAGDTLAVILKKDQSVIFASAASGSQSELELFELFGGQLSFRFRSVDFRNNRDGVSVGKRFILEHMGVDVKAHFGRDYLDLITARFGGLHFPASKEFSQLACDVAGPLEHFDSVDEAVIGWWNTEEAMFCQLEAVIIEQKLATGFADVDDFLSFSLSIRQRRNARAGKALENHLAQLLCSKEVGYSREARTEQNKRPDFIFPCERCYRNPNFAAEQLTMLAVKTTCKDRWRQILTEAHRIPTKHLLTLQTKISANQIDEMKGSAVQLVVPRSIQTTYTEPQRAWLWDIEKFVAHVTLQQRVASPVEHVNSG